MSGLNHNNHKNNMILHRVIRRLAGWAIWSFFSEVHIIGEENVPDDGPLIVVATHHNMMLDPAILSSYFPHKRILNYWAKASLFGNPVLKKVLLSSGNIPVDRKSKDNRVLFKGTFDVLARGEAVALFPEGTSYTEPRIMQVKDGASWSALEYMKWAKENPDKASEKEVVVVPAAIVYTNKSKYRSEVIIDFGEPISLKSYEEQFLSNKDGEPRAAVKRLTQRIETDLTRMTINAPDWDTLFAARMTRSLLWEKSKSISLDEFVPVSQTLVDLFSTPNVTPNANNVKRRLLEYYSLLQSTHLTNSALSSLPLPELLDPHRATPLPSRLYTLLLLIRDTLSILIRMPFFLIPLLIHAPAYLASRWAATLVQDEEETQAQNKVVVGLLGLLLTYSAAFFFVWALLWYEPVGALVAFGTVWLLAVYHVKLIDDNYRHAKQLVAAWRVLVGVWAPKRSDLSLNALQQYLTPNRPPVSQWIDKKPSPSPAGSGSDSPTPVPSSSKVAAPASLTSANATNATNTEPEPSTSLNNPPKKENSKRRPPTRKLVRHVLRARAEAARALASFFAQLESGSENKRIYASPHLAALYGSTTSASDNADAFAVVGTGSEAGSERGGTRAAREVLSFLRARGARIAALSNTASDDYWASRAAASAMSSEAELTDVDSSFSGGKSGDDEAVWVPPLSTGKQT